MRFEEVGDFVSGVRVSGKAFDVSEADTLHGGREVKRELRGGEEVGGSVRRLQEVDDGYDIGEGDV